MKKTLSLALCLALVLSIMVFAPASAEGELIPCRYYMPGSDKPMTDEVTEAINEKLHADGVMIDFQPKYIPWDQWVNKTNVMLSSGEEFELLHIMEDYITTSNYTGRGALTPLDDLIDEYAPELWDRFDDILWTCATVNGKVMTVPAFWRDNSGDTEGALTFNDTWLEQYGMTVPVNGTLDELIDFLKELQGKLEADGHDTYYIYEHSDTRCPVALHRTYEAWPFYASQDGLFQVFQDGTAQLYFKSEEFKNDCAFFNRAFNEGLVHPDCLNQPLDEINQLKTDGEYLMGVMTGGSDVFEEDGVTRKYDFTSYWLNPDGPFLLNLPLLNSNAVPSTTQHPEAGILFLNWMYSDKANQDLVLYGIEGETWNPVGDDEYELIKDEFGSNLYAFDSWMIEYVPYHRFNVTDTSTESERADFLGNVRADQTVVSVMTGFNFNTEPVAVEYANMVAEYTTSILPIKKGVLPYDDNIDAALAKMEAAGCDAVIAEYQAQLTAYIESQK